MNDLIALMGSMSDVKGKILIPGIYDTVAKVTDEERALYKDIDFDMEDYRADLGHNKLTTATKEELLMSRWRFPSLSLHGACYSSSWVWMGKTLYRRKFFIPKSSLIVQKIISPIQT